MLSIETKRKIDNARDVLVGKIPNPQAQIEQITTALIYKFMDDMDEKSKTLGGKARFFVGDFEKFSWRKLLDPRIGGQERMNLYSEAVQSLSQNSALPQIFRDVFKDAFVPYRDPETLSLFLKEINWFDYHHSEELGNAYEYLLSIMSSQGDAGQFRTPRHIIDFIVDAVDPQKDETILDPACGTAGFLISAYKHIVGSNDGLDDITGLPTNQEQRLKPEERAKMLKNFHGYDIDPGMVRLSLVNMYLHGFVAPNIEEYDSLTYEDRWNDDFDVILANPPFMTPKGGVRPHKRFQIQANRAEVLFVDYIAEHLKPKGRAGIVVPEGIIFQSGTAYKSLRKMLVEEQGLWAVVSLPAGVFQPYSGVKTSILLLDKDRAKHNEEILFIDIKHDGYSLGAQRSPIKNNDFLEALNVIKLWKSKDKIETKIGHWVNKKEIAGSGEYGLSGSRYNTVETGLSTEFEMVELGKILDYEQPTNYIVENTDYKDEYRTPVLTAGKTFILGYTNETKGIFESPLPVIIFDDFTTATKLVDFPFKVKSSAMKILKPIDESIDAKFVFYMMQRLHFKPNEHKRFWISEYSKLKIPLPPIEIQKRIVADLDCYQKLIDGAQQVIDNWKPEIKVDPQWDLVKLNEVFKLSSGKGLTKSNINKGDHPVYGGNGINGYHSDFLLDDPTVAIGRVGAYCGAVHVTQPRSWVTDNALYAVKFLKEVDLNFLAIQLERLNINQYAKVGGQPSISQNTVYELEISLPTIAIQKQIVESIEKEREIIKGNIKLRNWYMQKSIDKIAEVWGERST